MNKRKLSLSILINDLIILSFLKILRKLFWNFTFKMRNGLVKGFKRRFGLGFKPKFNLTEEETFLTNHNFKGMTVYDIGGYIGIHSIFFADAVRENGKVITFEPNPTNFREIAFNLKINNFKNVQVFPLGIGKERGILELNIDPIRYSRSSFNQNNQNLSFKKTESRKAKVKIDSIDNLIKEKAIPPPNFVKIDVEGFESEVIQGMIHTIEIYKPDLFIEIHGRVTEEMIKPLFKNKYKLYQIELKKKLNYNSLKETKNGHLFCFQSNKMSELNLKI